ncbi:MAG: YihY/virulence factor BrkB family protein, partial [Acidimicrobiales bacterium]
FGYHLLVDAIKALIARLDRFQQAHRPLAIGWAVNKKYGDDRGGYLAALVAYYGFISVFPLMLAFFSVVAFVLPGNDSTIASLDKHLGSFPVIGTALPQIQQHKLGGSVLAVVLGLLGLIWGATGLAQTLQYTMDEVWSVRRRDRAGFLPRLLTALEWYVAFGVGVVVSVIVSSLGSIFNWGPAGPVLAALPALAFNMGLFVLSFRILSDKSAGTRQLVPGALVSGVAWTVLTGVGLSLVTHQVKHASALYGTIGVTLGFVAFLYLVARITLYAAEWNVVRSRHLYPRSMTNSPLSGADKQVLSDLARREEQTGEQRVNVEF